ncbi:hypothetical protein [Syntrophomonas erecta]
MLKIVAAVAACGFVVFMLFNNRNMKTYNHFMKRKKSLEESIKSFTATQQYANQNMAIAVNQDEKKLCVSTMKNGSPVPVVYHYNDVIACEVIEYKVTDTNNQVHGQKVINILGDSVGKVIDGHSGKEEEERINRIDLKISFNDPQNTFVLANFLLWEVSKDSEEYKLASKDISHWYGIINNIVKKAS